MNSELLTKYQIQQLQGKVGPMRHYLEQLTLRMRACEFPLDDGLLVAVDDAADAINVLSAMLDCLSSRDGQRLR